MYLYLTRKTREIIQRMKRNLGYFILPFFEPTFFPLRTHVFIDDARSALILPLFSSFHRVFKLSIEIKLYRQHLPR